MTKEKAEISLDRNTVLALDLCHAVAGDTTAGPLVEAFDGRVGRNAGRGLPGSGTWNLIQRMLS